MERRSLDIKAGPCLAFSGLRFGLTGSLCRGTLSTGGPSPTSVQGTSGKDKVTCQQISDEGSLSLSSLQLRSRLYPSELLVPPAHLGTSSESGSPTLPARASFNRWLGVASCSGPQHDLSAGLSVF